MFFSPAIKSLLFRYLVASWKAKKSANTGAVSVFLPMLGVAVGVYSFIVVLGIMSGFVNQIKFKLLTLEPHIEVVVNKSFGFIPENKQLLEQIRKLSPEIIGVTPFIKGDAIVQFKNRAATLVLVGVEPNMAKDATNLEKITTEGNLDYLNTDYPLYNSEANEKYPAIILGKALMMQLGAYPGDRLTLVSTISEEGPLGLAPLQMPVTLADRFEVSAVTQELKTAFTSLNTASTFFNLQGEWAGIMLKLKDPLNADEIATQLNPILAKYNLRAKSWTEANKALLKALQLEHWGMSFVLFMIILVACFSITITLVLAAKRKVREMAILRAMGLRKGELGLLFLLQGFCIGLIGLFIGLISGISTLYFIQKFPIPFLTAAYNGKIPVLINWADIGMVLFSALFLAIFAAIWPAFEVMRINVIETLADY